MTTLTIELPELDNLTDQDLWHIVHTAMNRVDLTSAEENHAQDLLDSYDHAVLIRAKAMALLKKRGHDFLGVPYVY
ncbi:MAG: hypothetical protein ABFS56_12750 [Pseudomonadota bacterium]